MHRCITTLANKAPVQRVCDLLEVNRSGYPSFANHGRQT